MLLTRAELLECSNWKLERYKSAARRGQLPIAAAGVIDEKMQPEAADTEEKFGHRKFPASDVLALILMDHFTADGGISADLACNVIINSKRFWWADYPLLTAYRPAEQFLIGVAGRKLQEDDEDSYRLYVGGTIEQIYKQYAALCNEGEDIFRLFVANLSLAYRQARTRARESKLPNLLRNFEDAMLSEAAKQNP